MTHTAPPPAAILLATDLSARCDRALSRALQLARQWNARLVVATVLPPAPSPRSFLATEPAPDTARLEQRLHRDIGTDAEGIALDVRVIEGHVGRALLQLATEEGCGLIVTGIASDPAFELPLLGSTVLWLTRHSPLPLLVVHQRVRGPYRRFTVATDFSDSSVNAANHALALFGQPLQLALVHALETPGSALLGGDRDVLLAQAHQQARTQARAFLAGLRPLPPSERIRLVIEPGDPAPLLQRQAAECELVVVATHGRGALFELLIGSIARRLVATLETDTLLVRDQRSHPPL